jgi:hypothetical protein
MGLLVDGDRSLAGRSFGDLFPEPLSRHLNRILKSSLRSLRISAISAFNISHDYN